MFYEINGLPLHPLAVHGAVVLVPLAALLGLLFAVPRTRAWSRLPLLLVSLAAVGSTFVARASGQRFEDVIALSPDARELIDEHSDRADLLFILVIGFAVVAIAAFALTRPGSANTMVSTGLAVLLVVGAVALVVQVVRVGDIGTRAVYDPSGTQDFSGS